MPWTRKLYERRVLYIQRNFRYGDLDSYCEYIKTLVTPINTQFTIYVFYSLTPTCFGVVAIFRELAPQVH